MPYPSAGGKSTPGAPGVGVASSTITYQLSSRGDVVPSGEWLSSPPQPVKGQYLWSRTITSFTNGTTTTAYSAAYSGSDGSPGAPGSPGGEGDPGSPGQPGKDGVDGVGVSSSMIMYRMSDSGDVPPANGWSASMPVVSKGKYLWTRTATSYTDGSSTTAYSLGYVALDGEPGSPGGPGAPGNPGSDGKGVSAAVVSYQSSTSGTVAPTGSWSATVPATPKGQYLWSRTVTGYTDGTSTTAYSVSYIAADGVPGSPGGGGAPGANGVGVASTTVVYQTAFSGTVIPTGSWAAAVPSVSKGQFLWTRVVMAMTDASSVTYYSVAYHGVDGTPGGQGNPGANGISYNPQAPVVRTTTAIGTAYQHTDTTKPYKVIVNARATSNVTLLALGQMDRVELKIGPTAASVALGAAGGVIMGVWETGITGISVTVGTSLQDGGQLSADVPAGWYFSVNRQVGTSATIVNCITQSMTA